MTSMSVSMPLDDGFLRRECPHCERQFKWHHGPTDDRPGEAVDPDVYVCPYCGETAPAGEWWTEEQLAFARDSLAVPAVHEFADELRRAIGGDHGLINISVDHEEPGPPLAIHEPSDMVIVLSPCHPWEPIKVMGDWSEPIHCLLCGALFAVG